MTIFTSLGLTISCISADGQPEITRRESRAAAKAAQDYASEQKAEFINKMNRELNERWEELVRFSKKIEGSPKPNDAHIKLAAIREKWALAQFQLDQAERATESDWNALKDSFTKSYDELSLSINETKRWLNSESFVP